MTQKLDSLNTTLTLLPNTNTPLPRLQIKYWVHFNIEPVTLNISIETITINNPIIQLTPQQLVNFVRQFNSENNQQPTIAHNFYYLQTASTQTPTPVEMHKWCIPI